MARAMRTHHTKTSSNDWDGSATEARIPRDANPEKLKSVFAWMDPESPESKTAYKFPHHEVTSRGAVGPANERAALSGIQILNGGRGGADIPKSDRTAVYRHLATHLKDAGKEPPDLKT